MSYVKLSDLPQGTPTVDKNHSRQLNTIICLIDFLSEKVDNLTREVRTLKREKIPISIDDKTLEDLTKEFSKVSIGKVPVKKIPPFLTWKPRK